MPAGRRLKSEQIHDLALQFAREQILLQMSRAIQSGTTVEYATSAAPQFFRFYDAWLKKLEQLNSERDTDAVGLPSLGA